MPVGFPLRPELRVLAVCLALSACQDAPGAVAQAPPPPEPSPINGIGYVVFASPINRGTSRLLIDDLDKLQAKGARQIVLGINSPGGEIDAAQAIVAEMDRLHDQDGITFNAYNLRLVASAATLVFLDAQARYAVPHSGFIFHAPFVLQSGAFSSETLRKNADTLDRDTQMFRDVLLARTHLTKQQVDVYVSRTVVLSPDDAQHDGVIDAVEAVTAPKGARAWLIKVKPKATAPDPEVQRTPATQAGDSSLF